MPATPRRAPARQNVAGDRRHAVVTRSWETFDDMFIVDFLYSLPLWLLGLVLNACLVAFGLIGLWIARRWLLPRLQLKYDDAYFGAAVVQSVMLLYGLIAALTAYGV